MPDAVRRIPAGSAERLLDDVDLWSPPDDDNDEQSKFPYAQLIGELLWIAMNARPDITFAVVTLSRFLKDPKNCHWTAAKCVV